ncbi:MAG TPA: flavin reductase, partial [Bacteroidales bacterium]|nr:flavin reductase [Bacteroidales bacterium]
QQIGYDWMLVTAGTKDDFNTMTAAWGGLGFLWNKPLAIIFIRPQRYTYGFVEKYDTFSLSFFGGKEKKALNICGTKSGRDIDKMKETGLIPLVSKTGNVYYEQAELVIDCKKVYYDDIDPSFFLEPSIARNYPKKDYHRMYFGFITNCIIKV